jgi:hypothetical protein
LDLEAAVRFASYGSSIHLAKIGNGEDTNAWFDTWSDLGPLCSYISPRAIHAADFSLNTRVSDLVVRNEWTWPQAWYDLFPVLINLPCPILNEEQDSIWWKVGDIFNDFSTSRAWNSIRARESEVHWGKVVWFSQCIPKHAFCFWLVVRKRLVTQDRIRNWNITKYGNMNMICCLLCHSDIDSHQHLFFQCSYSNSVWDLACKKAKLGLVGTQLDVIINYIVALPYKSMQAIIARLTLASCIYHIWRERNSRFVSNHARPPDVLFNVIMEDIRYKLMGLKFKTNLTVLRTLADWKIRAGFISDDAG